MLKEIAKDVVSIELIYRASRDGWDFADFHRHCDDMGPTLSLIRSTKGYLCAGYTSLPWTSAKEFSTMKADPDAFICSLTKEMRVFRPD